MNYRRFLPYLVGVLAACVYLTSPIFAATSEFDFTGQDFSPTVGPGTLSLLDDTTPGLVDLVEFGKATDFTYDNGGTPTTVATMPDGDPDVMYFQAFPKPTDKTTGSWDGAQAIRFDTASDATAGYNRINQYTFIYDILVPNIDVTYMALFDCQPDQKDGSGLRGDAEFFIKRTSSSPPTAGVGISGQYNGEIHDNEWHRIAVTVDLLLDPPAGYTYGGMMHRYIDGVELNPIHIGDDSKGGADMRYSLGRGPGTPGGDGGFKEVPFLFYDLDPETNDGILSSMFFTDGVLTSTQIAALGGPSVAGIVSPGDFNIDGAVDVSDLGILATNYGATSGMAWEDGDATGDGAVDVSDLGVLATNYGAGTAAAAVPEPAALVLLAGAMSMLCFFRRR